MDLPITTLHTTPPASLLDSWAFEPYVALILILGTGLYTLAYRKVRQRGDREIPWTWPVAFYAGMLAFALALGGPLHTFNQNSFAVHMSQHVVLMLVVAPLLVLGRPVHLAIHALGPAQAGSALRPVLRRGWVRRVLTFLTHPLVVVLLFNVNLLIWHLPRFYVAALEGALAHEVEHMLFFGLSLLFWWVIVDPIPRHHRLRAEHAILVLFTTATVGDLLGLLLIFAREPLYGFYEQTQIVGGLSAVGDQRLGGLIMLVSGTLVYFGATFWIIARAYARQQDRHGSPSHTVRPPESTHVLAD
jgi:putative membrane protein